MSPSAFLSGASGFVGSHLLRELHGQGWNVHVLARPTSSLDEIDTIPATIHIGDIIDAESIKAAMPDGIDAVFHVAASTNFWSRNNDAQTQINVDGKDGLSRGIEGPYPDVWIRHGSRCGRETSQRRHHNGDDRVTHPEGPRDAGPRDAGPHRRPSGTARRHSGAAR